MRSAPPDDPDSDSLPIPDSLPNPPKDGTLGGSAGRATGRPPPVKDGFGAAGAAGRGAGVAARTTGLGAAFGAAALATGLFRLAGALFFAVVRLAVVLLAPDRFAVLFFAAVRLAVDFLPPARLAVDFFAVDFFLVEDFFFAGIFPPSDARCRVRAWFMRMRTAAATCDL
jgi:hypothetical protein